MILEIITYIFLLIAFFIFIKLSSIKVGNRKLVNFKKRFLIALFFPIILGILLFFGSMILVLVILLALVILFIVFLFSIFGKIKIKRINL